MDGLLSGAASKIGAVIFSAQTEKNIHGAVSKLRVITPSAEFHSTLSFLADAQNFALSFLSRMEIKR